MKLWKNLRNYSEVKPTSMDELMSISPIDGRYQKQTVGLRNYFSEFALMKYRVQIEIEYFIQLVTQLNESEKLSKSQENALRNIYKDFSLTDAYEIKKTELTTNHDVKAVEYFVKSKLEFVGLSHLKEWIHFGLTSQDINNTAIPLSLKDAAVDIIFPLIERLHQSLITKATAWSNIAMLARTHGQPASPTKLGKEVKVFTERISIQLNQIKTIPFSAKFGGATGNFNAHFVAFPNVDWVSFADEFVENTIGLSRSKTTTQIEHYDNLAAWCHAMIRINTILIDLCRDFWMYISMNYFTQKINAGEIGSSAMPHKVNPIDFENAEGNLGYANAIFSHLAEKLPVSRLQRDLTDSTVLRNLGIPVSHSVIAFNSILKGLEKLVVNEESILNDLAENSIVIAEAIQTILRVEGYPNPYEALKELTRGKTNINQKDFEVFIDSLDIDDAIKSRLKAITPNNYTGVF